MNIGGPYRWRSAGNSDDESLDDMSLNQLMERRRQKVIEQRSLVTLLLDAHLCVESILVDLVRKVLPSPQKLYTDDHRSPTFAQTVKLCEAMDLVDDTMAIALRDLNQLRNAASHTFEYVPSIREMARFLGDVSVLVSQTASGPRVVGPEAPKTRADFEALLNEVGVDSELGREWFMLSLERLAMVVTSSWLRRYSDGRGEPQHGAGT